ncbi:suppressor of fused domain protein [Flavobacterium procerum]|uniref:Suppressor of fused domain protein n=1 Tax=Flavobacterium procerum TaxID=1455569 RepID=A0ABV6BPW7_9FLAO
MEQNYSTELTEHYNSYFGVSGKKIKWEIGPTWKTHPEFFVLEFAPNNVHNMWAYCTVGMSADLIDDNLIELVIYSQRQDNSLVELLTVHASHHRLTPFNIHHTSNIGRPWLEKSECDHAFISLPYLDGENLEIFQFEDKIIHCYWLIPITLAERDYKIEHGCEALEELFEEKQLDYLNPLRTSLV